MGLQLLTRVTVTVIFTIAATASEAGPLDWLAKAGRAARRATPKAAAVARLGRPQALALASALGAGTVYIEARSGKLLLEAVGVGAETIEGRVDDLGRLTQRVRSAVPGLNGQYLISAESATELGGRLDTLIDSGTVYVAEPEMGAALRLTRQTLAGQSRYFKQVRPNVLVPLESAISAEAAAALAAPLQKSQISVVSMFSRSDVDALQKLAAAAGDRLEDTDVVLGALRGGSLEHLRNRTIIVVGHIEDGALVARNGGGQTVYSVQIDALEKLAAASDAQLLTAGCYSFGSGARAGFLDSVSDTDIADAVRVAFEAQTNADLLEAFARTRPLVVSDAALEQFAASRTLHLNQMAEGSKPAKAGALSVRLMSVAVRPSALREALEALAGWYAIGLVALILMFKSSHDALLDVFPRLPSPRLPDTELQSLAARTGRNLLFIGVGPFIGAVTMMTFLFGGWPYRRSVMGWLWGWFRHPLRQIGELAVFVVLGAVIIVTYSVVLSVLVVSGAFFVIGVDDLAGLGLAVVVGAAYSIVAIWGFLKAHRAFQRWLSSFSG